MQEVGSGLGLIAQAALSQRDLSALEAMLQNVAQMCGALGAVLWQLRIEAEEPPGEGLDTLSKPAKTEDLGNLPLDRAKLLVLAQGFLKPDVRCAYHDLGLSTPSGQAILEGESQSGDCANDARIERDTEFFRCAQPGSLFAIRLQYEDNTLGALTIYRHETGELSEADKTQIRFIAQQNLTTLYAAILDRVNYSVVEATSRCLDQAIDNEPQEVMKCIAEVIARTLKCREASIFLENSQQEIDKFQLEATSCQDLLFRNSFQRDGEGLTALVARSQRPVLVFDLLSTPKYLKAKSNFDREAEVETRVRKMLDAPAAVKTPPISFVAVPIPAGDKTVGVLRCQLRPENPHYFSESDVELLKITAARIGSYWSRRMRQQESEITNELWQSFVDDLNRLEMHLRDLAINAKRVQVNRTLQEDIFLQGLSALKTSIRGADILDVALVEADRNSIQQIVMKDERSESRASQNSPGLIRLPLSPPKDNSWAHIFHNYQVQRTFFIQDTDDPKMPYREMYPKVRQALFSPMVADNQCIGILSIRTKAVFRDPEKAKRMASLVALQIGLYHQLTTVLSQQTRTYQDMAHQLRTPVFQARKRVRSLVDKNENPGYDLLAVNGLMAKTQRVLSNMQLYEDLALDHPIAIRKGHYSIEMLTKLLHEACVDNGALWSSRNIVFTLDRESFQRIRASAIQYDSALLEQVINNLLDNAGKYSQPSSDVTVSAWTDQLNRTIEITIKNQAGLRIEKHEIKRFGERGFRSEMATRRTAEGSGIGLFLAKKIMLAHKGDLIPTETDPIGFNKITISIPL